ncbi:Polyketide synthase PksR [Corynebacterium ciconiae DSM 44920]|uniref:class I SAM-dependent methyltransferase n=1 Tax=Corynebacterium ciconiae TaxID=227319 RepID=UPI00037853E0|nr:class I SAM-dependent methyltransferase [Corynebacterium ciconiae]WKD61531.1 Polyketide synthase PksR [Corynebacterium ciconiae DSM 44920]
MTSMDTVSPDLTAGRVYALKVHHVYREQAAYGSISRALRKVDYAHVPAHLTPILRRWESITSNPDVQQKRWRELLAQDAGDVPQSCSWSEVRVRGEELLSEAGWDESTIDNQKNLDAFFSTCDAELESLIVGENTVRQILFDNDALSAASAMYQNNPISSAINTNVASELAARAARCPSRLAVAEIGAGTGALTDPVLDALRNAHVDYTFSDVSRWFLHRAKLRYAGRPSMNFGIVDINDAPGEALDSLHTGSGFDVIACGNVAHNALRPVQLLSELSEHLRPNGSMYLIETGTEHLPLQISMRFLMAPDPSGPRQEFQDARGSSGRIFLNREEWVEAATAAGLTVKSRYPEKHHPLEWLDQFSLELIKEESVS